MALLRLFLSALAGGIIGLNIRGLAPPHPVPARQRPKR